MPFAVALSLARDVSQAAREVSREAMQKLGEVPELAIAFYSPHHAADAAELASSLSEHLGSKAIIGIQGESVIGLGKEIENRPAISLFTASWRGAAEIVPFHLYLDQTPDGPTLFGWPDALFEGDTANSVLLTFGDPYTFPVVDLFLPTVNEEHPGLIAVGGLASSPTGQGSPALFLNGEIKDQGGICVLLRNAPFRTVVSQGCRPVGRPLVITKGQDNVISEVSGQSPLQYLRELLEQVPPHEKDLMQRGLLIGLAISEYRDEFRRGDFLIRNLIGLDPKTGALAVTDRIRRGQTIQFQVRDAATASEDLDELLQQAIDSGARPKGGILFSCNGRGTRMFPNPNHDAEAFATKLGIEDLAGIFAAGEIGPVAGTNSVHGFTASAVLFE
jgi:small ligand-binding sensory domain FIST